MATIRTPTSRPQMATVRPGIFKENTLEKKDVKVFTIERDLQAKDSVTKIIKIIEKQKLNLLNL